MTEAQGTSSFEIKIQTMMTNHQLFLKITMTINETTTSFDGLFVIEEFLDWLTED